MTMYTLQVNDDKNPNYEYKSVEQYSINRSKNSFIDNGLKKTIIAGTIILNLSMGPNLITDLNFNMENTTDYSLNFQENVNDNYVEDFVEDSDKIKVTVIGSEEYEYTIKNINHEPNTEFLEGIYMKKKHFQNQLIGSTKYGGMLPRNPINEIIENDELYKSKRPNYIKKINSSAKNMGKMPKKTIV